MDDKANVSKTQNIALLDLPGYGTWILKKTQCNMVFFFLLDISSIEMGVSANCSSFRGVGIKINCLPNNENNPCLFPLHGVGY